MVFPANIEDLLTDRDPSTLSPEYQESVRALYNILDDKGKGRHTDADASMEEDKDSEEDRDSFKLFEDRNPEMMEIDGAEVESNRNNLVTRLDSQDDFGQGAGLSGVL